MFYWGLVLGAACGALIVHSIEGLPAVPRTHDSLRGEPELRTDQLIPRLDWDDVPLDRAIAELRSLTGTEIYFDRSALITAGVGLNAHISAHLRNVTLGRALARIADQMGTGNVAVGFGTVDGVILISTPDALPLRPVIRAYDIRDLVASDLTLDIPTPNDAPPMKSESEQERGQALVKLVTDSADTDSWRENGGSRAVCTYLSGRLFVCAPPYTQQQVESILRELRECQPAAVPPPVPQEAENQWIIYPLPSPQLKAALWRRVDRIDIDAPFPQAAEQIGKTWGVPLSLDLDELRTAGLSESEIFHLALQNASLLDTLNRLCADPRQGVKLAFKVDANSIRISTQEHLSDWAPTFVYNVRDMIGGVRYVPQSDLDPRTRQDMIDDLTRLIETTVAPESWKDNGGSVGALRLMYGQLVITQSWENQQRIQDLLARLRAHGMTLHAIAGGSTASSTQPSQAR